VSILVSGSHGLIGSALIPTLAARGHRIVRLVRHRVSRSADEVAWDPAAGWIDAPALEGLEAVIHLAGEPIAAGRWTAARKARIRGSRIGGTRLLAEALARLRRTPQALICASATGYYGSRGEEILVEESAPGTGFLAEACRDWEAAAAPARDAGIRVVHLRSGLVLSPTGGVLAKLLRIFRLGLGAILHVLAQGVQRGPVNLVSPHPVTNREFTATLGRMLRRPALFPVPAPVLWIALGEVAGELLGGQRVHPTKLLTAGYAFRHPDLEAGLRAILAPTATPRTPA
jgi:NAD dependent epimerase/dehydratase family enzyme